MDTKYTATSLDPFTQYKCCIEPHWTTNGVGPTVCVEQMTLEDGRVVIIYTTMFLLLIISQQLQMILPRTFPLLLLILYLF